MLVNERKKKKTGLKFCNSQSPMNTGNNASLRLIDYFEGNHHVSIDEKEEN